MKREQGARSGKRYACIMKPETQLMYCGKLRGLRDGEGRTTAGSIAKYEPDVGSLCAGCRTNWGAELTADVTDKLRMLEYLGSPYDQ